MASNKVAPSPKKEDEMSKPTQPLGEIQEVGDEEDQGQVKPKCHPLDLIDNLFQTLPFHRFDPIMG